MPHTRLKEGLALAKTGAITASIDSSDGLAWSLNEISRESNIGFMIDYLPIAPETIEFAELHKINPFELVFYGGEEYELVFTVQPNHWRKVEKTIQQIGGRLFKIGEASLTKGIFFKQRDKIVRVEKRGYEHFKHREGG
jgi:thiamine-monophosphate kinase